MSETISAQSPNTYEMQTPAGQGSSSAADQQHFNDLGRLEAGAAPPEGSGPEGSRPPARSTDPKSIDYSVTNPFTGTINPAANTVRMQAAAAAKGHGEPPNISNMDVHVAEGERLKFGSASGETTIRNAGRVKIAQITPDGRMSVPDNTGRVRIKDNEGHLETENNLKMIKVKNNNNDMEVYENKGLVKVNHNEGELTLGDENRAGISQGQRNWHGVQRENGRVTVGDNQGGLSQHYGKGSLGSFLHLGGPTEVTSHGAVKMTPSGPGGKVGSPVVRGTAGVLVGTTAATGLVVGAANAIGTYNGANGLAHPTHAATAAAPSTTTHAVGLASATGAAGNADVPHVTVPEIHGIR